MRKTSIIILLILSFLFYSIDYFFRISQSIIIPQLAAQYHIEIFKVAVFASVFYLGYATIQIPSGFLLEKYSVNVLMGITSLICSLAYLGFLYTESFWLGCLFILTVGATSAISFIGILYIARVHAKPKYFAFIVGLAISAGTISASVSQCVVAYLIREVNWHYALSSFSVVLILISISFFLFKVPRQQTYKKTNYQSMKSDLTDLVKQRVLIYNAVIGGLFYLPTSLLVSLWGVPFMIASYHVSSIVATTAIIFLFSGWALGSPMVSLIASFYKRPYQLIIIFAFFGLISSLLFLYLSDISNVALFTILFFFGLASSGQTLVWKIFDLHCPQTISGVGIAFTNAIIMLCASLFHLIIGFIVSQHNTVNSNASMSYQKGLMVIPFLFLIVIFAAFSMERRYSTRKYSVNVVSH